MTTSTKRPDESAYRELERLGFSVDGWISGTRIKTASIVSAVLSANESPAPEPCNGCGDSGYPCPYCPAPQADGVAWLAVGEKASKDYPSTNLTCFPHVAALWRAAGTEVVSLYPHPAPQPPVEGLREALDELIVAVESECYLDDKSVAFRNRLNEAKRAALASPSLTAGWQPIETAPRDGTRILIWFVHAHAKYSDDPIAEGWEAAHEAYWIDHNGGGWTWHGLCGVATYWQPLPSAPATLIEQSGAEETHRTMPKSTQNI